MWLRSLIVDHFWLKLFSVILATLIWLAVANVNKEPGMRQTDITKDFRRCPIEVMTGTGAHPAVRIEPATVDIVVRGGRDQIEKLEAHHIRAFVRIPDSTNVAANAEVQVQLPREVALVHLSDLVVRVQPTPPP